MHIVSVHMPNKSMRITNYKNLKAPFQGEGIYTHHVLNYGKEPDTTGSGQNGSRELLLRDGLCQEPELGRAGGIQ